MNDSPQAVVVRATANAATVLTEVFKAHLTAREVAVARGFLHAIAVAFRVRVKVLAVTRRFVPGFALRLRELDAALVDRALAQLRWPARVMFVGVGFAAGTRVDKYEFGYGRGNELIASATSR